MEKRPRKRKNLPLNAIKRFEPSDYSAVVKKRAKDPKPWRWEIYRAGRSDPIDQSSIYFETMTKAHRAGKDALKLFLDKHYA